MTDDQKYANGRTASTEKWLFHKVGLRHKKALEPVGHGIPLRIMLEGGASGIVRSNVEEGLEIKAEQGIRRHWSEIDNSRYRKHYKRWKSNWTAEKYWEDKEIGGWMKYTLTHACIK